MPRDRFAGQFEAVLEGAQNHEPWALERIYRSLSPVVTGYLRLQGCREPEDQTSEVFLGVLRNLPRFDGGESAFRSWVMTIAHHRLVDERRRTARQPPAEPLSDVTEPEADEDVPEAVDLHLAAEQIDKLCHRLAPDQRDVLLLRLSGQMTVDEAATALGKTTGAVRSLQNRGFAAIGRLLDREGVVP